MINASSDLDVEQIICVMAMMVARGID